MTAQTDSNMTIKEVIQAIESKQLSIKQLADQYKVSDRTIQNKIKRLGYKWMPKEARYTFEGEDESILESNFDSLLNSPIVVQNNSTSTSPLKASVKPSKEKQRDSIAQSTSKPTKAKESPQNSTNESDSDIIDILLSGKHRNNKRVYRGFYFDSDVLSIIDSADSGNKSELVNQALRKVFKDKGLL